MIGMFSPSFLQAMRSPEYFQAVPTIVAVDPSIPVASFADQIGKKTGLTIGKKIEYTNMFGMVIPRDLIETITSIDGIDGLYMDHTMYALETPFLPIGSPMDAMPEMLGRAGIEIAEAGWIPTYEAYKATHLHELWRQGIDGTGVDVAVLDTGVDNNQRQLLNTVIKKSAMKPFPSGDDGNGHGSHCITTIKGRNMVAPNGLRVQGGAPNCNMTSWKCLGFLIGTGSTSDIMYALEQSVSSDNKIISMSLGSSGREDEEEDPLVTMIDSLSETHPDVLVVVAAGNSGPDEKTIGIPAIAKSSIAVGSWGVIDDAPAYFSGRGSTTQANRKKPDIMAPGGGRMEASLRPKETIYSGTSLGSLLDTVGDKYLDSYTSIAGTSMATPHVAAILACWKQIEPDLTAIDVKKLFKAKGHSKSLDSGWGLVDARWIL